MICFKSDPNMNSQDVVNNMIHALKNYSRVLTRLWNNFFWNNFQGIIFEGGRYTIMHVGI